MTEDADTVAAMRQAHALRGAFERLADGTWATVFAGDGATEMATRAARFALFVRHLCSRPAASSRSARC